MKTVFIAAMVLVACDKPDGAQASASASASAAATPSTQASATTTATTAAPVDTTTTTAAGNTAAGGFEPKESEWFGLQNKMMGAYDHFDTCAKLAANLDKWNADNKEYLGKFREWAKKNPDRAKTFKSDSLNAHKAEMAGWTAKIQPAQKCMTDAKVGAALKAINEE